MLRLFAIFSSVIVLIFATTCPIDGEIWKNNCYQLFNKTDLYISAELNCQDKGGHLASIDSEATNHFLNYFLKQNVWQGYATSDVWIGATNLVSSEKWIWTDGSEFSNFGNLTMTTRRERCGTFKTDGTWKADDCFKAKSYICAIPDILKENLEALKNLPNVF